MKIKKSHKLVCNLYDKNKYVVYIRTLKEALNHGLIIKKAHKIVKFNKIAWLKFYTKLEQKQKIIKKNAFFKLMSNTVFGETMENVTCYACYLHVCREELPQFTGWAVKGFTKHIHHLLKQEWLWFSIALIAPLVDSEFDFSCTFTALSAGNSSIFTHFFIFNSIRFGFPCAFSALLIDSRCCFSA